MYHLVPFFASAKEDLLSLASGGNFTEQSLWTFLDISVEMFASKNGSILNLVHQQRADITVQIDRPDIVDNAKKKGYCFNGYF